MNLAEIRKKAQSAQHEGTVAAAVPPSEAAVEPRPASPVLQTEAIDEPVGEPETALDFDEFSSLPELPAAAEEVMPADVADAVDAGAAAPSRDDVPQEEAPPAVAAAPPTVPRAAPQDAAPARAGYDPLATILSGRAEAVDPEDVAAFHQQVFAADDVEEYLCFRVADEEYALNIMAIKEIIKPRDVTEVPRMPGFIAGVISLRGVIIPVLDMRLRLSLPAKGVKGRERIIVLHTEAGFCGVLVDEVVQVARIRKADIEDPPAVLDGIDRDFVRGLGHYDNRMLILLNLETIIDISSR